MFILIHVLGVNELKQQSVTFVEVFIALAHPSCPLNRIDSILSMLINGAAELDVKLYKVEDEFCFWKDN